MTEPASSSIARFSSRSGAHTALAYGALVLTSAFWGSNSVIARILFDVIPPVALSWLRWAVVLVMLLPLVSKELPAILRALRDDWKILLLLAFLGGVPQNTLTYAGLTGSSAIQLGLLNSVIPVMIVAIGWVLHNRTPRRLESFGIAISLLGVMAILFHGDLAAVRNLSLNPFDLLMLCSMINFSFYTIWLNGRPTQLSLPAFLFAIGVYGELIILPIFLWETLAHGLDPGVAVFASFGAREWLGIAYLGAVPTIAGFVFYGYGVARVGAVKSGIFSHLVPVFSVLFAVAFAGESLQGYHVVGFVLVAGGAVLSCLKPEPVKSLHPPQRGGLRN